MPVTLLFILSFIVSGQRSDHESVIITINPNQEHLITDEIQHAVDSCASVGGGTVYFPKGTFLTGGIILKSHVTISLAEGATIQGSDDYRNYGAWDWSNALFRGDQLTNVSFTGKGTLDGVDCTSPKGEAGFRGPHCIRITRSTNLSFQDITIVRSANYAINCNDCDGVTLNNVTIRGGHDGLHTRFSSNVTAEDCDFRTGDDAFAGHDNRNFVIRGCRINTSCNAFRLGCQGLLVEDCRIWGPGEYKHIAQNRNNTLSAFVHFSPEDSDPVLRSGDWLIKDVTVENVDNIYVYNYRDGLWQTGQPMTDLRFEGLRARDVKKGFTIRGDSSRRFRLTLTDATFTHTKPSRYASFSHEGTPINTDYFLSIDAFDQLVMDHVSFRGFAAEPLLEATNGNAVRSDSLRFAPKENRRPFRFRNVKRPPQ